MSKEPAQLTALRRSRGLSLADLRAALPSHPSEATLSRFERGGLALRLPDAAAYADALRVSLEDLHRLWWATARRQLGEVESQVASARMALMRYAGGFLQEGAAEPAVRGDGSC